MSLKSSKNIPISQKAVEFAYDLTVNLNNAKVYRGSFENLKEVVGNSKLIFKEHPLNVDYVGVEESRDWIHETDKSHRSFFSFWKELSKAGVFDS